MSTKRARCLVLSVVCLLSFVFAESAFAASEISVVREWDDVAIPSGGSFGFGLAPANTPDSRRFRIYNTGNSNLVIGNPTTLVSGAAFSMIAEPVGTVQAGMSTTFRVQFLASAPGDYHGAITIHSNDADENPYVIHLYGGVTAPPSPDIGVVRNWDEVAVPSGGSYSFGNEPPNTPDSRIFRIHNTGNADLNISNPTALVSGEGFSMIAYPVGTVYAGASTIFRVQFVASAPGEYHGAITIQSNDPDENPYVIHLHGTVTPPLSPEIAVVRNWDDVAIPSGGSFSFGNEPPNTPDSRIFRIHNTGNGNLDISNPTALVSGDGFSMIAYPVGTVYAGASTIFRVQFVASAPGDYHGAITIHSNDPDENPYVIHLHGAVNAPLLPEIAVLQDWDNVAVPNGGSFTFPAVAAGSPDSRRFRITNTGNGPLNLGNPTTLVSGTCFSLIETPVTPIAPGDSAWFRVRILCSTPGTYTGTVSISSNDADENPYTIHLAGTVVAAANGATFISQNFPAAMAANQFYTVSVTMKNSGTTTWTAAKSYRLGVRPDAAAATWRFSGRVDLSSTESIAPGATKTFSFQLQAPSTPGSHSLEWRMVEEWVQWFGDTSPLINVTVGGPPPNNAAFVSQSVPTNMSAGQAYSVSVTMQNTGSKTWSETTRHRLGSQVAGDPWGHRILLPAGVTVVPGQQYTFSFQVTAPATAGTYNFTWRMVEEFVEWFGATTPPATITVGPRPNDAAFVSQSVPANMSAGQQYTVSVTMRNTGTKTWSETTRHRLGSQVAGDPWGHRILLPAGVTVAPGQQYTFSFQVTAPATAGTYNFTWRMVEELVEWFGATTPNVPVSVTAGDFNVSVRPDFMRVQRGKSITASVSIAGLSGFNAPVSLSVIDLPAGTTASFQPASILPGGSSTLTIHAASSGPFGDTSIRVRGTSGGLTRNMTATLRVMDPQAKPAITAIQPETIPAGESSTVILTGSNFHTSEVTVGNAEADRAFPTITVVDVSADGTRMELLVDATDPSVLHHYGLYVKSLHGEDGISFRVVPAAPVIDYWSPSEVAGGTVYAMDLVGANLQGATVISSGGGVSVFDVDSSEDELLSAFLKVEAGAPNGPIDLIIRGRNGGDATIRVEILQQRKEIQQKTSAMTNSKGEPLFYIQELKAREDLLQSRLAKNPASVHGGFEFEICADWGRSRSRGRVWTRTWFKNPLTGEWGPLGDAILNNLTIGEVRLLETLTFTRWFFLELSMHFRVCLSEDWGLDYDVEACITGSAGFHVPIVGGLAIEFELCLGNPSRWEIDLTGTGYLSFIQFHRRGSTGPESLQCVQFRDVNPESGSGERVFEVELTGCCTEEVGASWSGDFYLGTIAQPSQAVGTASPENPQQCSARLVDIRVATFIPVNHINIAPCDPIWGHCVDVNFPYNLNGLLVQGDDRNFDPTSPKYRILQTATVDLTNRTRPLVAQHSAYKHTRVYAEDAIENNDRIGLEDDDPTRNDCRLFQNELTPTGAPDPVTATWFVGNRVEVKFHVSMGTTFNPLALPVDFEFQLLLDDDGMWSLHGEHDCIPAYEVYINGRPAYQYMSPDCPPGRSCGCEEFLQCLPGFVYPWLPVSVIRQGTWSPR